MNEATEANQSNPEHQNINFAELRAQLAQIKETSADPHWKDIDLQLLTEYDLEMYNQYLQRGLTEQEIEDWKQRVMNETPAPKSEPTALDNKTAASLIDNLPNRMHFVGWVANKITERVLLKQRNNWVK